MEKYNGWTNYETWVVNLWMFNDGGGEWEELAQNAWDASEDFKPSYPSQTREQHVTYEISKQIQSAIEENSPTIETNDMYSDLLSGALSAVNWYEIAEHMIENIQVEAE